MGDGRVEIFLVISVGDCDMVLGPKSAGGGNTASRLPPRCDEGASSSDAVGFGVFCCILFGWVGVELDMIVNYLLCCV